MANIRKDVPPGWAWEDGKPRWNPSRALRAEGWKGRRLADARGAYLERGASIDMAQRIADAVAAWKTGELVPADLADCAPDGACDVPRAGDTLDPFTIGALIDAYLASNELRFINGGKARPESTQRDYRNKLKRMVDVLAGFVKLPETPAERARYAQKVAAVRAMSVFHLAPVQVADKVEAPLYDVYWVFHRRGSKHQAYGVLACASAWLAWCRRFKNKAIYNWAEDVDRETPPGRIRTMTWPEIAALVAAADSPDVDLPEVADALILAIDLHWSKVDVVNLVWPRLVEEPGGGIRVMTGDEGRQKTGRVGGVPLTGLGQRRVAKIRERQAALDETPLKVIYLQRKKQYQRRAEADGDLLGDQFAIVRAAAAKVCPSCAELTFADTRDTGISLGRAAGLDNDQTASRSLHSRQTVNAMMDRAYGEIGPAIADTAHAKLDAYVERELAKHGVKL